MSGLRPEQGRPEVGLGLGSNVGDSAGHIRRAAALLVSTGIVDGAVLSSLYRTPPWGPVEQGWFVNACLWGRTALAPAELLARVKALEVEIGRIETVRWGPRVIDIDILCYGDIELESPDLVLPHREIMNRSFVLEPLAEIRPDLTIRGHTLADLIARLGDPGIVRLEEAPARGEDPAAGRG